jgi:hypothetical protein
MELQHDNSWDCLTKLFASKLTAKDAWDKFIDFHETTSHTSCRATLKELNIDGEQGGTCFMD